MNIVSYIRTELGHPVINIELTDDQITQQNQNAIEFLAQYNLTSDILSKKLTTAYCFKLWGIVLGKYDVMLKDDSKVNHESLYLHGCNEESLILSLILKSK
jgi:hypothetical protein